MIEVLSYLIVMAVGVLPVLFAFALYNGLVTRRTRIAGSWGKVATELKRRHDLVPKLIETVRGYAAHERDVLEAVTARCNAAAANHESVATQATNENLLTHEVTRLLTVAGNYPDLKADENFRALQRELAIVEDGIQDAQRSYNANVRNYRTKRESFPSSIVASLFSFPPAGFLQIEPAERANPKVAFPERSPEGA